MPLYSLHSTLNNTPGKLDRAGLIDPNDKTGVERGEVTRSRSHSQEVAGQQITNTFSISLCTYMLHIYKYCKPTSMHIYPLVQVQTYHFSACCEWRAEEHFRGSSSVPKQIGTYTPQCHSGRPGPRWWCRSDRPGKGKRAVSLSAGSGQVVWGGGSRQYSEGLTVH